MVRPKKLKTMENPTFSRVDIDKICKNMVMCSEAELEVRHHLEALI